MKKLNSSFKKTLLASLVVPCAFVAQSASAAKVSDWNYVINSDFSGATFTAGTPGNLGTVSPSANVVSWGETSGSTDLGGTRSSVSITDLDSVADGLPTLQTDGPSQAGSVFTHTNNIINADYRSLTGFNLGTTLTLIPSAPAGVGSTATLPTIDFQAFFTETPNNPSNGICADNTAEPAAGCGDIFTLGNIGSLAPQSFVMEDYLYTVFLTLTDLMALTDDACEAAGDDPGCLGLLTPEAAQTQFKSSFSITAVKVPEPGTLALLGLGIAGLGLSRRKLAAKS